MAQVSRIHNGAQSTHPFHDTSNSNKPKSASSISLRPQLWGTSKSRSFKYKNLVSMRCCEVGKRQLGVVKASASFAAAEKPSMAPDIVLGPIYEISGTITLPGSKSLSNRILLLAALSEGTTVVDNLLNSEDVHDMLGALKTLGLHVEEYKTIKQAIVGGCEGLFPTVRESKDEVNLFLGNAGIAMRHLTAAVTAAGGTSSYILDGVPRMRERPIGDLVAGLKQLGADVDCFLGTNTCSCNWEGRTSRGKDQACIIFE